MEPIFFTVESSTENPVGSIGIATVTFNEFIPYELFPDDPFSLQRISRILTSSHSFEYVGAGTDINISTPLSSRFCFKADINVSKPPSNVQMAHFSALALLTSSQSSLSSNGEGSVFNALNPK